LTLALNRTQFWFPTGECKTHALTHVYGVVTDSLVEAGDDGELYGELQIHLLAGVRLEDCLDELTMQCIEE
jgi:hypothetical protein